jgi:hypothetical protein
MIRIVLGILVLAFTSAALFRIVAERHDSARSAYDAFGSVLVMSAIAGLSFYFGVRGRRKAAVLKELTNHIDEYLRPQVVGSLWHRAPGAVRV